MKKSFLFITIFLCFPCLLFSETARYKLFQTQNMWTLLKLDTMTGQIWQVQYSVKGDEYRFESVLSSVDLAELLKKEKKIGRYILYPTSNTYNFILLDQFDGETFQVQWAIEAENRAVFPISEITD